MPLCRLQALVRRCYPLLLLAFAATAGAEEGRPFLVGFAQDTLANDWRAAQVRTLQQALADIPGITFIYSDAKGSTAKQISDIEDMLLKRVDVLITSPRDTRAMIPVLSRAYQGGTPVILLTRRIDSDDYTSFIAPDDEAIARAAARHLNDRLGARGAILMLQGVPSTSTAMLRSSAFVDELKGIEHGPSLVVTKVANYLRSDAIQAVEEALREGVAFNAIYAQSDSMASGARLALAKAGYRPGEIPVIGIDYIAEAREAIRRGEQDASFTYPTCGEQAAKLVRDLHAGKRVPKHVLVPSLKVTKENVEQIEPIF